MRLNDINSTVFKTLDTVVQRLLIENQRGEDFILLIAFVVVVIALYAYLNNKNET